MKLPTFLSLAFAAALFSFPLYAADTTEADLQKGKQLYDEALPLLEAQKFNEACPKLEEAVRLVPIAVGARIALGECEEGRGRLASALLSYKKAESLATAAGQPDRATAAQKKAQAVQPKVGTLHLTLNAEDDKLEGLTVELDGTAIDSASRNTPIPLNSGTHSVRVTAPGRAPFVEQIPTTDGKEVVLPIKLSPETPPASSGTSATGTSPPPPSGLSTLRIVGIAAGALGVVALGAGGGLGGLAASKNDESFKNGCTKGQGCPPGPGTEARNAAYDAATLSTALFIGGGVLAAAGVTLIVVGGSGSRSQKGATAKVALRIRPSGFSLQGDF